MIIAHTADFHLSSQRTRTDAESGLNARLMDFYRCARYTIEHGLERGVDLFAIVGDAFNGARPTPTEVRLCKDALAPALEAGRPIVMLLGNHEATRSPAERHALDLLLDEDGIIVVEPIHEIGSTH